MIGGRASFVGAACPSRFRFSTVEVQFLRDRALGVACTNAFPPTGCQASVHPRYRLVGFSHQNSPTVCAWLVRRGRRAGGVWQARNPRNSTLWQHFVRKTAINTRIRPFGGSGAAAVGPPEAGPQRRIPLGEPHKLDIMATCCSKIAINTRNSSIWRLRRGRRGSPRSRSPEANTIRGTP